MGVTNSKAERSEALRLCKERKKFIKRAIDSRYNFAASHVAYIQSLKNIGVALRRFAEAEVLIESSVSASVTENDKTPTHSSYHPSPSPSNIGGVSDSPLPSESPLSAPVSRVSYMRSGGTSAVTVRFSPSSNNSFVDDGESMAFPMPPPPPPFHEFGSSWDYFDPTDDVESFRFVGQNIGNVNLDDTKMFPNFEKSDALDGTNANHEAPLVLEEEEEEGLCDSAPRGDRLGRAKSEGAGMLKTRQANDCEVSEKTLRGPAEMSSGKGALEQLALKRDKSSVGKEMCTKREDPSEFITHRAKDFLSSIKDIEHRFFRASECGREVSRMLEANKIRIGYSEARGNRF